MRDAIWLFAWLTLIAFCVLSYRCVIYVRPAITPENGRRVVPGMKLAEVERILGPSCDEQTREGWRYTLLFNRSAWRGEPFRVWPKHDMHVMVFLNERAEVVKEVFVCEYDEELSALRQMQDILKRSLNTNPFQVMFPQADSGRAHTTITGGVIGRAKYRRIRPELIEGKL